MASNKIEKEIKMRISKIREIEFSCKDIPDGVENIEFGKDMFFALHFAYTPNPEKKVFALKTFIKYTLKGQQEPILIFVNEILFDVIGMDEVVKIKKVTNKFEINNDFLIPLISVAIGTTRGMLAAKTTGKKINDFPIPMLNPKEILDKISKKPDQ